MSAVEMAKYRKYIDEYGEGYEYVIEICLLKLKSLSNITPKLHTVSDSVMLWLRIFVGKKRLSLLRCLDIPIIMKYLLLALILSLLFMMEPAISLRQSPICLREISVSAVDKDMYTWVSSAYKWWSNLWLDKLA